MNVQVTLQVGLAFLLLLLGVEFLRRRVQLHPEYTRKIAHVLGGLGVVFAVNYISKMEYLFLGTIFLLLFILHRRINLFHSLQLTSRRSYGELTYVLGLVSLGLILYDQRNLFVAGVAILCLPDAVAGLAGFMESPRAEPDTRRYLAEPVVSFGYGGFHPPKQKEHPHSSTGKTRGFLRRRIKPLSKASFLRSSVYFFVTMAILVWFIPFPFSLLLTLLLTLTERYSPWGLDNFTVPLVYILSTYLPF